MTDHTDPPQGSRIAFERLRERTDELELIVSGMLAFALLTLPGRIFETWAANSIHVEGVFEYALQFGFLIAVGLSYSLAFAFIVHLAIRGYWIALIGLKSTFPDGIRWDRIPLMGAISRGYYRERVSDLGVSIDRVDRVASILFAMAILLALTIAWVGVLAVATILCVGLASSFADDADRIAKIVLVVAYVAFMVGALIPLLTEKAIAGRRDAPPRWATRLVRGALRVYGVLVPQRLIMPVQLTLQSNLPGRGFLVVYFLVLMLAMVFGGIHVRNSAVFSMVGRYDVLTDAAVDHGMLNAHYESLRSEHDVLLRYPMIPSDRIAETHLRLFIPHRPQIDNPLARERCKALDDGRNAAEGAAATTLAVECIGSLWTATLDGEPVALDGFVPMERRDLGLRGLVGYLDIGRLAPGRHDLQLHWNVGGDKEGLLRQRKYFIPFWFAPGVEQASSSP